MDVVKPVFRIDFGPFQQERLAVGSERLERRSAPATVQRGVVQPHDDGLQCRRIVLVRQRVEGCGAYVRVSIVERGDDLSGAVPGLDKPECTQRECAPPPEPTAQVAVGELEHRQRLRDGTRPRDSPRVAILDERLDHQPREKQPVSRGTGQQCASGRLVSLERTLHERAVPLREAPVQRPLQANRRSLHDDRSGHCQRRRDCCPDKEG